MLKKASHIVCLKMSKVVAKRGNCSEVKVEIRDDNERLHRSANGQFELFLLTSEGSSHSDGSSGLPLKSARMMVNIGLCERDFFRKKILFGGIYLIF